MLASPARLQVSSLPHRMRPFDLARASSLLVFVGYLALARAAGNVFPFSSFNMYSTERLHSASRIIARDADGHVHELDRYVAWDCEALPDIRPAACPAQWPFYHVPYLDRGALALLSERAAALPDAPPVTVVRRVFRLTQHPGEPTLSDCTLATCRAVPR